MTGLVYTIVRKRKERKKEMTTIERLEMRKDYWQNRIDACEHIMDTEWGKKIVARAQAEIRILDRRISRISEKNA